MGISADRQGSCGFMRLPALFKADCVNEPRMQKAHVVVSISQAERNSRRRILPTLLLGNSSRNSMYFGRLYAVKLSWQ